MRNSLKYPVENISIDQCNCSMNHVFQRYNVYSDAGMIDSSPTRSWGKLGIKRDLYMTSFEDVSGVGDTHPSYKTCQSFAIRGCTISSFISFDQISVRLGWWFQFIQKPMTLVPLLLHRALLWKPYLEHYIYCWGVCWLQSCNKQINSKQYASLVN